MKIRSRNFLAITNIHTTEPLYTNPDITVEMDKKKEIPP